jgi:hypothetical protein
MQERIMKLPQKSIFALLLFPLVALLLVIVGLMVDSLFWVCSAG